MKSKRLVSCSINSLHGDTGFINHKFATNAIAIKIGDPIVIRSNRQGWAGLVQGSDSMHGNNYE